MNTEECRNLLRKQATEWKDGTHYQRDDLVYDKNYISQEGAHVFTFYKTPDTHTAKDGNHPILNPTL